MLATTSGDIDSTHEGEWREEHYLPVLKMMLATS